MFLFGVVLPTLFLSLFDSGLALSLALWPMPAPLLSHECRGPRESLLGHRGFIELISVMMRSRSSISFVGNWPNICFCNRILKVADVASSVFVGGVFWDRIVAEQHYDIDAAANARNTSFPLVPAGESEAHYSRVNFGGECCSRLRNVFPNIIFVFGS